MSTDKTTSPKTIIYWVLYTCQAATPQPFSPVAESVTQKKRAYVVASHVEEAIEKLKTTAARRKFNYEEKSDSIPLVENGSTIQVLTIESYGSVDCKSQFVV